MRKNPKVAKVIVLLNLKLMKNNKMNKKKNKKTNDSILYSENYLIHT